MQTHVHTALSILLESLILGLSNEVSFVLIHLMLLTKILCKSKFHKLGMNEIVQ